jgi:hypothetical protein
VSSNVCNSESDVRKRNESGGERGQRSGSGKKGTERSVRTESGCGTFSGSLSADKKRGNGSDRDSDADRTKEGLERYKRER